MRSKESLNEVSRCHYGISLKSVNSVWFKTKFVFEESYFSNNGLGIWTAFLLWGEGIWTSQSSKLQMPRMLPSGDVEASIWLVYDIFVEFDSILGSILFFWNSSGVNTVVMQVYRGGYFAMEFFTAKKERTLLNCRQEQQEVCEV